MEHKIKTVFLLFFAFASFLLLSAPKAQTEDSATARAEHTVEDYFTAFKAYNDKKVYALIDGKQEQMIQSAQGNAAFKTWVESHNIRPKNVAIQCSYCIKSECRVLAHVVLERHPGTRGDDVIFIVSSADTPQITESYIDKAEASNFASQSGATCTQ